MQIVKACSNRSSVLRAFISRYQGTDAALEAEVDLVTASSTDRATWLPPLDALVQQYPGTTAAAKALSEKAFQLSTNLQQQNVDPTAFLEVFAIVGELESGRYPVCEWVTRAPWLGFELHPRNINAIAQENVDRLLAAYSTSLLIVS